MIKLLREHCPICILQSHILCHKLLKKYLQKKNVTQVKIELFTLRASKPFYEKFSVNSACVSLPFFKSFGAVHKRRHQSRGRRICQKMISLLISLFDKNDDKGGRGSKISKSWWRLLWMAQNSSHAIFAIRLNLFLL